MSNARNAITAALLSAALMAPLSGLTAQACNGTPRGNGIAAEYGLLAEGHALGVSAQHAGGSLALGAGYRRHSVSEVFSGHEAYLRTNLVLGRSFMVCPGIQFGFQRDTWDVAQDVTVKRNNLGGSVVLSAGLEQQVAGDLALIPFAGARYTFNLLAYEMKAPGSETSVTGDTLSNAQAEYGLIAAYRSLYAGYAAGMNLNTKRVYIGRFILGIAWGGSSRAAPRGLPERRRR